MASQGQGWNQASSRYRQEDFGPGRASVPNRSLGPPQERGPENPRQLVLHCPKPHPARAAANG